jgi:hypothetical protein
MIIIALIAGILLSSCAFLGGLFGEQNGFDGLLGGFSLNVLVEYSGTKSVTSSSPLYIVVFDYGTKGLNPVISDKITSISGSYTFNNLGETSYCLIVFLDANNNYQLDYGEIYQFYNNKGDYPDSILVEDETSVTLALNDSYKWDKSFFESFNDGVADNWIADGTWSIGDGFFDKAYKMTGPISYTFAYSYFNNVYSDFTYSVDVWQEAGNTSIDKGLLFRFQDPNGFSTDSQQGYMVGITSNGDWFIVRWDNGLSSYTFINNYVGFENLPDSSINKGLNKVNTITVECSGNKIDIYINGNLIETVYDSTYSSGYLGVYSYDPPAFPPEPEPISCYDNVTFEE